MVEARTHHGDAEKGTDEGDATSSVSTRVGFVGWGEESDSQFV